jgi:heme A synthase
MSAAQANPMDTLYRWVAAILAAMVFVQALLAGQGWFVDPGLIQIHGLAGNATFIVVIVLAGLAFATRRLRAGLDLGLVTIALILVIAQIGLGYAGRESASAASWHVPNGVLVFGLSIAIWMRALAPRLITPEARTATTN